MESPVPKHAFPGMANCLSNPALFVRTDYILTLPLEKMRRCCRLFFIVLAYWRTAFLSRTCGLYGDTTTAIATLIGYGAARLMTVISYFLYTDAHLCCMAAPTLLPLRFFHCAVRLFVVIHDNIHSVNFLDKCVR